MLTGCFYSSPHLIAANSSEGNQGFIKAYEPAEHKLFHIKKKEIYEHNVFSFVNCLFEHWWHNIILKVFCD